jgi:hypothetical protein
MAQAIKVHPSVVFTELEDAAVLLHLDTKRYFTLNSTGVAIWQAIVAGKDQNEIVAALAAEYAATHEQLSASVARLLSELEKAELIVRVI